MKLAGKNDDVCSGSGCFNASRFVVVPRGKWRKMPARAACGSCVKGIAEAYKTEDGILDPGWADTHRRGESHK